MILISFFDVKFFYVYINTLFSWNHFYILFNIIVVEHKKCMGCSHRFLVATKTMPYLLSFM